MTSRTDHQVPARRIGTLLFTHARFSDHREASPTGFKKNPKISHLPRQIRIDRVQTTLAPAPVMEPGLSAVHATDRVETPVETPAVSDEERDASVRMPAEEDTHASDDKLGEKSGKKQSQRQRLSEACIESLSAMHGGKPEAVGFYKDDIIAAVKAKHGYTDKPEIYQIVLGDAKVFAREVGTRKQGVKQGR